VWRSVSGAHGPGVCPSCRSFRLEQRRPPLASSHDEGRDLHRIRHFGRCPFGSDFYVRAISVSDTAELPLTIFSVSALRSSPVMVPILEQRYLPRH
jgi:hypothetical protein